MDLKFTGKTVLITGASEGIGGAAGRRWRLKGAISCCRGVELQSQLQ